MEISRPVAIFFSIILITGLLTSFTDLKSKKIYNQHLIIGAVLGLIATAYTAIFYHENVLFHIINGLVAFLIGFLLHRFSLWRGGDAKLFALYAFLMPPPTNNHLFFPGVISLFACSFIIGMLILFPVFIKDIIINHKAIQKDLFLPIKRQALFKAVAKMIGFSWVLLPLYHLARITNPVIILTTTYLFFSLGYDTNKDLKKNYVSEFFRKDLISLSIVFSIGILVRLWAYPNSLSFLGLLKFIVIITLSAMISTCIHTTFDHFKNYHDRVPFAPLLLSGCVLSYTSFLTEIIHLVARWNVLFSR
jgi:Flp pilus assembly protein protease CpaA